MSLIFRPMPVYQIGIGGDTHMRVPQFCTCCLAPTKHGERIHFTNTKRGLFVRAKTHTFLTMPLCSSCRKHRREQQLKKYLALFIAITAGFAVFLGLRQQGLGLFISLWLFSTFALAIFFLADKYFPLSKLDKQHSSRGSSTAFAHVDANHHLAVLNFTNKEYVKRLCAANHWTYSQGVVKSEVLKYTLIIVCCCLLLGAMFQDLTLG